VEWVGIDRSAPVRTDVVTVVVRLVLRNTWNGMGAHVGTATKLRTMLSVLVK